MDLLERRSGGVLEHLLGTLGEFLGCLQVSMGSGVLALWVVVTVNPRYYDRIFHED